MESKILRKEMLVKQKLIIKSETNLIRELKKRNKKDSQEKGYCRYEWLKELIDISKKNKNRHALYFGLKNIFTQKYNQKLLNLINNDYPHKTAIYLNEIGFINKCIEDLNKLDKNK